jgi:hypothetical protein
MHAGGAAVQDVRQCATVPGRGLAMQPDAAKPRLIRQGRLRLYQGPRVGRRCLPGERSSEGPRRLHWGWEEGDAALLLAVNRRSASLPLSGALIGPRSPAFLLSPDAPITWSA